MTITLQEALDAVKEIFNKECLNDLQEKVFCQIWEGKTYPEIARDLGYDDGYIKYVGFQFWKMLSLSLGEKITKKNFRSAIKQWQTKSLNNYSEKLKTTLIKDDEESVLIKGKNIYFRNINIKDSSAYHQYWNYKTDVSFFYGRSVELTTLVQWITQDYCRLITVVGTIGIGKTALVMKLVEQIQNKFDCVIWQSLYNAPPIEFMLTSLINFLSNKQEINLSKDVSNTITQLLYYLQKQRCLLVIDNVESILCNSNTSNILHSCSGGHYQEGYEDYSKLFRQIGELCHNSCLVLISREKLREVVSLAGSSLPIRIFQLKGLDDTEARQIIQDKGIFFEMHDEWKKIFKYCSGNPLFFKRIASIIQRLFAENPSKLSCELTLISSCIQDILEQELKRLSLVEYQIMYWLAIYREPVTYTKLQADIIPPILPCQVIEALESLERRTLIENKNDIVTLQPLVMNCMTNKLVEQVCHEIVNQNFLIFRNYTLLEPQSKEYIQDIQIKFILKPIIEQLLRVFGTPKRIQSYLMQALLLLQGKLPISTGYVTGNTINLLRQLDLDLIGLDFSRLTIWQANLKDLNLYNTNFSNSDIAKSVFTEDLGYISSVTISPDGGLLAIGDDSGTICLWRVLDGQQQLSWKGHTHSIHYITFSMDGKTLISSSEDKTIKLWDLSTGDYNQISQPPTSRMLSVSFMYANSLQGSILASTDEDHAIKLWNINTGHCYQTLRGHVSSVWAVALSSNERSLASSSDDKTIKLWDIKTGQCFMTLQELNNTVWSVTFTNDSETLITSGDDHVIRLWNINTGHLLKTLQGHIGCVRSVSCSSDGHTLASGSDDQTIKLWDTAKGQCKRTLQGHSSGVRFIKFSANGQMLISIDENQTVKVWEINTSQCIRTLQGCCSLLWKNKRPYENMNITGAVGLTETQKMTLKALGAIEYLN